MASVQGLYLALFNRPADPLGLQYFNTVTGNGADLARIGDLAGTAEYRSRFAGRSNEDMVKSLYQALFQRDGEKAGVDFFVGQMQAGHLSANTIAVAMLDGARGSDLATSQAKLAAADLLTRDLDLPVEVNAYKGASAIAIANAYLDAVTSAKPATEQDAAAAIAKMLAGAGQQPGGDTSGSGGGAPATPPNLPPVFVNTGGVASVPENTAAAIVGKISYHDPETGDQPFTLQKNPDFSMDATGRIILRPNIDYEALPASKELSYTVESADGTVTQTYHVAITDWDEPPQPIAAALRGNEDSLIFIRGTDIAADPEGSTVKIVSSAGGKTDFDGISDQLHTAHVIVSAAGMNVEPRFNFDALADGKSDHLGFDVIVADGTGHTSTVHVDITVEGKNDAPSAITFDLAVSVPENFYGFGSSFPPIAHAVTGDPDAGETFTYSVDDDRFTMDSSGNLRLKPNAALDYEADKGLVLNITATDHAGAHVSVGYTVPIGDFNDPDPNNFDNMGAPTDDTIISPLLPTIYGGAGNDTMTLDLIGALGLGTTAYGGSGNDTISVAAGLLSPVIVVYGGDGNDMITNAASNANLRGGAGNDTIVSTAVRSTVIDGGDGNDILSGGSADDTITGGNGYDHIAGRGGSDSLSGGNGNDTFVYVQISDSSSNGISDMILDFSDSEDKIDLSAIDARTTNSQGDQAFKLGTVPGEGAVVVTINGGVTSVDFYNAASGLHGHIDLVGVHTLTAQNFIL